MFRMTTAENCNTAREVHKLLSAAKPHKDDINLARAAGLAFGMSGDDEAQERAFRAIQKARDAISNGLGAADGEEMLLKALRSAEQWVRCACSD
jgi:hypothetical protein